MSPEAGGGEVRSLPLPALIAATLVLLASAPSTAADRKISFAKDIQPLLQNSCWKCHGAAVQLSKLDLRSRETGLRGGGHGTLLMAGNAAMSPLFRLATG